MLMDHGTLWWASASRDGLTRLSVFLLKQGIQLLYGAVRHPQTQGKVERFHRTLGERLRWRGVPTIFPQFVHSCAGFARSTNESAPMRRSRCSPRRSASRPAHAPISPHRGRGAIRHCSRFAGLAQRDHSIRGTWHFVSKPCVARSRLRPVADRVLVIYRHMYVRELHPRSRRSVPLMSPLRLPTLTSTL